MTLRRRLGLGLAVTSLLVAAAGPVSATDTGTVDAQVTVATPCIVMLGPHAAGVDFGTLPFSSQNALGQGSQSIQVGNCASSEEQLYARGTDAFNNNLKVWTLQYDTPCSAGLNQFKLRAAGTNDVPFLPLSTTSVLMETVPGNSDAGVNDLQLTMPCAGSNGAGQTLTFQAIFTATF